MGPIGLQFFQNVFLESLRSFWSLKYGFLNIFGAWSSGSYEGTLNFFDVPDAPIVVPNGPRPPNEAFLDIFTRPSLISELYFP